MIYLRVLLQTTFRGKLVAKQDDFYTLYVFQNLEEPDNSLLRYVTTTRPPNWNGNYPDIGDVGFVMCDYVDAGEKYFQRNTGSEEQYKYTTCYFLDFIKEKEKIETNTYNF